MKKLINILLIIISIISFKTFFNITDSQQKNSTIYSENQTNSFRILVPDSISNLNRDTAYKKIVDIVNKYNTNIFTTITDTQNNKTTFKKYIYINNSSYFNNFKTKDGKALDFSMLNNNCYFASNETNDSNQVETILDFAGNDLLEIHSLKDISSLSGFYIVSLNSSFSEDDFINDLSNSLGISIIKSTNPIITNDYNLIYILIVFILYLLIILLLAYNILNSYKEIAVYKLLGLDNKQIWLSYIYPICIKIGILFIISSLILIPFHFKSFNIIMYSFIFKLFILDILLIFVSFLILSIPFLLLKLFKLTSMLKNNKPTKSIFVLNTFIKVIVSVICIYMLVNSYNKYTVIKSYYNNSYSSWEQTKDYYIFPYVFNLSPEVGESDKFTQLNKKLYFTFNKTGSILANFKLYSESYNVKSNDSSSEPYKKHAMINPNYLNANPIYDTDNNIITIDENEKDFILFVPEKYKNLESNIINYAKATTFQSYKLNDSQKLKIIWIKNDQKLFSYNLSVNPDDSNMVKDPFCFIVTEDNCNDRAYRQVFGFSSAGNPFKIKVNSSKSADDFIRPTLQQLGISQNLPQIISTYESVSSDITNILTSIKILMGIISLLFIILIFITIQNVINYYMQNKQIIIIKNIHGYKFKDKYGYFYKTLLITLLITYFLSILVCGINILTIILVSLISLILCLLECFISLLAFKHIEAKNIVTITKGGE